MKKLLKYSLLLLLSYGTCSAVENHQVGFKLGLTSIDNKDGLSFENGSFFTDLTLDVPYTVKPRFDLGYISIDEDKNGGVGSLWQLAVNGVYHVDLKSYYKTPLQPYLLGGLGYEYVSDSTPIFESHPFAQAGFGARYPLTDRVTLVSEFKALQMFGGNDEDNEFALMLGVDVPLFVEVIRAPIDDKESRFIPEPPVVSAPVVIAPPSNDGDNDGVPDSADNCPHTPAGSKIDINGCTIVSSVILPEEATYVEDTVVEPNPAPVVVKHEVKVVKQKIAPKAKRQDLHIGFESNSAVIKYASKARVKRFANYLKSNPSLTITIEGYTDNSGLRVKNLALSSKRAQAVRSLLIKNGVSASRVKAVGKGDLNPIADNDTPSGREKNRRIEAVIH